MDINDTEVVGDDFAIYEDDCIEGMRNFPDEAIEFSCYSPPFGTEKGGLYHYSSSDRDLSNNHTYEDFVKHYEFVVEQIHRLTMPGRLTAVHCMDVPRTNTGNGDNLIPFPDTIRNVHIKCRKSDCTAPEIDKHYGLCGHGWFEFNAQYAIWKEPLAVRNRTMAKKLAHKTIVEDSSQCGVAGADYLIAFRKKGTNPEPVAHPSGLLNYAGFREIPKDVLKYRGWTGNQIENKYSHWIWRQYASSIWDDIRIDHVLNYKPARDKDDEKHVHPLQLDVIERAIILNTNEGDIILDPFMGIGSTIYKAIQLNRRGIGFELKPSYFRQAVKNLANIKEPEYQQIAFDYQMAF